MYTPGLVLLTVDPVTWEYKGQVYTLDNPGVPFKRVVELPPVKKQRVVGGIPACYEEHIVQEEVEILMASCRQLIMLCTH